MPKLKKKKIPTPNAISQRISRVTRVANDMDCHPPNVLIKKWMKLTIGIPMTRMPEMDNKVVGTGDADTTDQSTNGMLP